MKNLKRTIIIILVLSLILPTVSYGHFIDYYGYNEGKNILATGIIFYNDKTNDEINSLTPGMTVRASLHVKKIKERFKNPSLILSVFLNDDIVKQTVNYVTLNDFDEHILSNKIDVPNISGVHLRAYLWDGINTVTPLANEALFSSSDASVTDILIDGKRIENFNPDKKTTDVFLSSHYDDYPVVSVITNDMGAKVKIKELYSFSSEKKQMSVEVTSQDGVNKKDYIINFHCDEKKVTSPVAITKNKEVPLDLCKLSEPEFSVPKTTSPLVTSGSEYNSSNLPEKSSKPYTDLDYYYINIKPDLIGSTVISVPQNINNSGYVKGDFIKFTINHSADIYINTLDEENFSELTDIGFIRQQKGIMYRIEPMSYGHNYKENKFYYKRYEVEKGKEMQIILPCIESEKAYSVIVSFTSGKTRITNGKINKYDGSFKNLKTTKLYNPKTHFGVPGNSYNMIYKSGIFSDSVNTIGNLPCYMEGSDALVLPYNIGNNNIKNISFTLNKTSALYFVWFESKKSETVDKMQFLSDLDFTRNTALNMKLYISNGFHNFPGYGGAFKKEYYLKPGETKEIVLGDIPKINGAVLAIYAGDIDYNYFDTDNTFIIEENNSVVIEAEDMRADVKSPFTRTYDKGENVIKVIGAPNMSGIKDESKSLTYPLSVMKNKIYYVWVRVYAETTGSDSLFISFDDGNMVYTDFAFKPQWQWVLIKSEFLTRGSHKLKFYHREQSIMFDKIVVTMEPDYVPDDYNWDTLSYEIPDMKPLKNVHPRLFVNNEKLNKIRENLTDPQNIKVYEKVVADANYNTNGMLEMSPGLPGTNINAKTIAALESSAFLYLCNNDIRYGNKAVRLLRNIVSSLSVIGADKTYISRNIGWALYAGALAYDWCYDLIDSNLKSDFIGLFHIVSSQCEVGWPPVKKANLNTHAMEGELFKDFLAVGIAVYDENENIYNNVAGRIFQELVPIKNYMSDTMELSEGATYGRFREFYTMVFMYMFDALGYENIISDNMKYKAYSLFYQRKPDGRMISTGDDADEDLWGYQNNFASFYFLCGNFYKDPYIKREYYRSIRGGNSLYNDAGTISPVMHLLTNDVTVIPNKSIRDLPLSVFYNYPSGRMVARTSWEEGKESDAIHVSMNITDEFFGGHQHLDSGHFDIYSKGTLALDSGIYESAPFNDLNGNPVRDLYYGSSHDYNYHKRTIAHNCLLIYEEEETIPDNFSANDGGQKILYNVLRNKENLYDGSCDVGSVISYDFSEDESPCMYSYLKGDLKKAYSETKVKDYQRTFMFLNMEEYNNRGILIVYDNVEGIKENGISKTKDKKTWLLHSEEEPVISGNKVTVKATTLPCNKGRLINNTLLPKNANIEKIGGSGMEFFVDNKNYKAVPKNIYTESGKWRTEISPPFTGDKRYNKLYDVKTEFLNVMEIGTNNNDIPFEVSLITELPSYNGVKVKDKIVYLRKTKDFENNTLTLPETASPATQIIDGLAEGVWQVKGANQNIIKTIDVYKGHNTLSFTADKGTYTLEKIKSTNNKVRDYSIEGRIKQNEKEVIDISINNVFETFNVSPFTYNDKLYLPFREFMVKTGIANYSFSDINNVFINGTKIPSSYLKEKNGILFVSAEDIKSIMGISLYRDKIAKIAFIEK